MVSGANWIEGGREGETQRVGLGGRWWREKVREVVERERGGGGEGGRWWRERGWWRGREVVAFFTKHPSNSKTVAKVCRHHSLSVTAALEFWEKASANVSAGGQPPH